MRVLQTLALPLGHVTIMSEKPALGAGFHYLFGAADEARTRYLHLGKVALYQMSYGRMMYILKVECTRTLVPPIGIEPMTRGFSVPCSTD